MEPSELELEVGETKELKVSCFPAQASDWKGKVLRASPAENRESHELVASWQVKEGAYTDTIIAKITDNPDPVEFAIAAIGSLPKASSKFNIGATPRAEVHG